MYDAIVIGLGGMGSASLFELARRGFKVLGIEQFDVPHEFGSSHGLTRIIRLAYFESPAYIPLLFRAYERWREIEEHCGEKLLYITGSIDAGREHTRTVQGSLQACHEFSLQHDLLDAAAVNQRFPGYRLERDMLAIFQPQGGFLLPERCIVNYVQAARDSGVVIRTQEKVIGWEKTSDGVAVRTASARYEASRLVITAGPWARDLVPELKALAVPERQVQLWTWPDQPDLFRPDRFPVFNLQASDDESLRYYGFPIHGIPAFKIGQYHHRHEQGDPEELSREVESADEELLREGIKRFFPKANGATIAAKTCMFTNSPDEHFILDVHPESPRVAIAAGFSGHGFKFCSVIGEIMADLVTRGGTRHNIAPFRLSRRFDGE
jgi:sarcosine oxidase